MSAAVSIPKLTLTDRIVSFVDAKLTSQSNKMTRAEMIALLSEKFNVSHGRAMAMLDNNEIRQALSQKKIRFKRGVGGGIVREDAGVVSRSRIVWDLSE